MYSFLYWIMLFVSWLLHVKTNVSQMAAKASAAHLHSVMKTFPDVSASLLHDLTNMSYLILQLLYCCWLDVIEHPFERTPKEESKDVK